MPKRTEQIIEPIKATFDQVTNAVASSAPIKGKAAGSILVQGAEIHLMEKGAEDFISLTDMTKNFEGSDQLIKNWLQNKNTLDFLGVWEKLNNPSFNLVEFHQIKQNEGLNRFVISVKSWVEKTGSVGLVAQAGRYGGTFAHKDIAFEFGSWLSPEFKLHLIKEFQRLKEHEALSNQDVQWDIRRTLAKAQYRVHTDAVKNYLIPKEISKAQEGFIYANEADLLNSAVFGMTSREWKMVNPGSMGTQRDNATIEQLVVLGSLESQNALLIQQGKSQSERIKTLNQLARQQMQSLLTNPTMKKLADKPLLN